MKKARKARSGTPQGTALVPAAKAPRLATATAPGPKVMQLVGNPAEEEQLLADLSVEGLFTNAVLMQSYSENTGGEIGITETMRALRVSLGEVNKGDLAAVEAMLLGQAAALNAMFAELGRRAYINMGEHLPATDKYMRLALKAQGQCRATLETLAAIKNPPLVFARQANINNGGQQQVNNGVAANLPAPAPALHNFQPTELFEESADGRRMDPGAPGTAGRVDPLLAAVGAVDGPAYRTREGAQSEQQVPRRQAGARSRDDAGAANGDGRASRAARPAEGLGATKSKGRGR
ncbi:hypothetical protein CDN99_26055 [Roseateles aquatilis]|uniref:Uncharacterized protein n=1 Tax=Roseateles aquatilis TaxID=431061 RepID=A0A246ITS6_9BURK|nr:hypothetical protein [Roseateles aquatilis]OWQ83596.1 hypothetical protein CDN99_26055 [Roseateles aquatilis]